MILNWRNKLWGRLGATSDGVATFLHGLLGGATPAPAPSQTTRTVTPPLVLRFTPMVDPQNHLITRQWDALMREILAGLVAASTVIGSTILTAQAATITPTAVLTPPLVAGLYRLSYYVRVTQAATTSSSVQVTLGWTDGGVSLTSSGAALTGNTTSTFQQNAVLAHVDADSAITYAASYASSGATPMMFQLSVLVESV